MGGRMRTCVVVPLLLLLLLSACESSAAHHSHPQKQATYLNPGIVFTYPAGWHRLEPADWSSTFITVLVYVGNVPLSDPCMHTVDTLSCAPFPRVAMPPGGVLVQWNTSGTPLWTLNSARGTPTRIAGRPSKIRTITGRSLGCPPNTAETIQATISRPDPHNWYEMDACLAAPVTHSQQQIFSMLRSIPHIV